MPSTILQSDVMWAHIHDRAPDLFSGHSALQAPTLLALDDFEMLMAIVEAGHRLHDVLASRLASPCRRMPPSHFFARRYPDAGRTALVDEALRRVADAAHGVLFAHTA